jgi:phosphate transport system permease protein
MIDKGFRALAWLSATLVLVILGLIVFTMVHESWPVFQKEGLGFVFSNNWSPAFNHFGAGAFLWGTIVASTIAVIIAVPVSIGLALFATEVAPKRVRRPVVYVIDLLAVIPSVVFGLWGLLVFAPALQGFFQNIADAVSGIPVLNTIFSGNPVSGRAFLTAGIILAIMITPIITSIAREVFATTPPALKEASLAVGATRWEMIRAAILPHSRSGLVSAIMIGLGRAMGETIAVALVIGSYPQFGFRLLGPGDAMASVIANQFGEATDTYRAALIGLGVILFLLTMVIGIAARTVTGRVDRRLGVTT